MYESKFENVFHVFLFNMICIPETLTKPHKHREDKTDISIELSQIVWDLLCKCLT